MGRRDKLIALTVILGLLWLFVTAEQSSPGPSASLRVGAAMVSLLLAPLLIAWALAVVIGALCRNWQSAVALNLLASLPALALALVFSAAPLATTSAVLDIAAPLAALGWLGWLLRSLRVEFND